MLKHLTIQNYALIRNLNIDFNRGFSVITGETGAGKSIMLGALGLILGERADTQVLLDQSKKCIIEGTFSVKEYGLEGFFAENELDFEELTILRREINKKGKSRAFINDSPVNLNILKELGDKLVNIHSQHKTITLNDSNFQLAVLDDFAGNRQLLDEYRKEYRNYKNKESALRELMVREEQSRIDQDYYQFQFEELDEARLKDDEQEEIEKEQEKHEHAAEIKTNLLKASRLLQGEETNIQAQLREVKSLLDEVLGFYGEVEEIAKRIESNLIDLQDIAAELENLEEDVIHDPRELEKLNERLDLIYQLQHKHRVKSVSELIQIRDELNDKLLSIGSLSNEIEKEHKELEAMKIRLQKKAEELSKNRKSLKIPFEKNITGILKEMGMPEAQFKIEMTPQADFTRDGVDQVRFLFNANKGAPMKEVSRIASGGELSRLMLAIKSSISGKNLLPTIVFDEIDMGVSGEIADKVGKILLRMSENMQVLAITHLPQIAGKGNTHYLVYKDSDQAKTVSEIRELSGEKRTLEIAKMLSGEEVSEVAVENARQLLQSKN